MLGKSESDACVQDNYRKKKIPQSLGMIIALSNLHTTRNNNKYANIMYTYICSCRVVRGAHL